MAQLLAKTPPINSTIKISGEFNQTIIAWDNPRGSWTRYFIVIFLLAWLGGWGAGEYSVGKKILDGNVNPFEIFWLIGWTVGGLFAMVNIYLIVRPLRAEKLILDAAVLQFKPGTVPFAGINWNRRKNENDAADLPKIKRQYRIPKNEVGEIKMERVGERQRLTIDHGVERIEIGRFLQEPEREWLFEILKQWKS